jgi:predicted N-acetyltransferase YhbS
MWIKDEFRGRGYGHRLLTLAEGEARQRGAKNVYLDTCSFQAPDFYKQHGYQPFQRGKAIKKYLLPDVIAMPLSLVGCKAGGLRQGISAATASSRRHHRRRPG